MGNIFSSGLNEIIKCINHFLAASCPSRGGKGHTAVRAQESCPSPRWQSHSSEPSTCTGVGPELPSLCWGSSALPRALTQGGTGISPILPHLGQKHTPALHMGKTYWHFNCSGMVWLKPVTGPFLTPSFGLNIIFVPEIHISHFSGFLKLASVPLAFSTSQLAPFDFLSQNHGTVWVGRDLKTHLVPCPCTSTGAGCCKPWWGYQPGNAKGRARAFLWCSFIVVISHGLLPLDPAAVSSRTSWELFFSFPFTPITQNRRTKIRMEQFVSNINNMKVYQLFTF